MYHCPGRNQAVVEAFLQNHPEYILEETGSYLPLQKREGAMVQLLPHLDGTDGFFIARMKRK